MKNFLRRSILCFYIIISGGYLDSSYAGVDYIDSSNTLENCVCEGGIPFLTVQYKGNDGVTVNVYAGDKSKKFITAFSNVSNGDLLKVDGSQFMHGVFKTRRYFSVAGNNNSEVVFHTSCSEDILGQTKGSFTVTSFTDNKGNSCSLDLATNEGQVPPTGNNPMPDDMEDSDSETEPDNTDSNSGNTNDSSDNNTDNNPSGNCFANLQVKNITCFAYTDGSLFLNLTGGTAPFTFEWSNGATSKDISDLSAGWYSVTVTDANNNQCILTSEVVEECAMSISYIKTPIKCFGDNNGAINVIVEGGKAPYNYLWDNGAETKDISGLVAGTYKLKVTDANGCSIQETYVLDSPENMSASIGKDSCNPGYLEANVEGGKSPYTYFWSNGAVTKEVDGLTEGNYTVIISDSNGCSISEDITLTGSQTPLSLQYSITKPTCNNLTGGSVDLTVTGGIAPYAFIWSNGAVTEDISNLSAGNYSVTVTDSNGCFESIDFLIEMPVQMEIYTTKFSRISCAGNNDGELDIVVMGGSSPYTYLWSNGETTSNIKDLSPGEYEVTVTDAVGCIKISKFQIAQPMQLDAYVVNQECNDGSVDLTVTGGTRPYTYLWSNGAITEDLTGLETGEYTVVVTDSRGCSVEAEVSIIEVVDPLTLSLEIENPKCGDNKGSAQLTVTGGSEPYTYLWSNGARTQHISNVQPGNYTVRVTDDNNCFKTASFTIQAPSQISIIAAATSNISCFGEEDGSIEINASGGTSPYSYSWSNGETTKDISGLIAGIYNLVVTDVNGCSKEASFNISQPEELEANITANLCNNPLLDLEVSGGVKPYQYTWSNGAKTEDLTSFNEGMYYVEVIDAKGCMVVASIEVTQPESINLAFDTQNSGCKCGSNGSVNLTVEGGTGPYSFLWSDGQTTEDLTGLAAGEYSVLVTDAKGCSQTGEVIIEESSAVLIELTKNASSSCAGNDGVLEVNVSGGTGPYTYIWSNGGSTSLISSLAPGNYHVKIVDSKGCSTDASFKVESSSGSSSDLTAKFESCNDQVICRGGSAEINVLYSGSGNWSFTYSDGVNTKTINTSDNPYILSVSPEKLTTYDLISLNSSCGSGSSSGSVTVGVNDCSSSTKPKSCATNCFDSKIIDIKESGSCTTYTMEVTAGNNCSYALSHFSVAVPCGTVSKVTNSRGWKVEIGNTDPTTGITGFKIDDIKGFGEDRKEGVFTVTYTVCNTGACDNSASTCEPVVAYKAGQCVNYDIANVELRVSESGKITAYPNPSADGSMTISLENLTGDKVTIDLKDMSGILYYNKTVALEEGAHSITLNMLKDFPTGIYLLMVTSKDKVYTHRIALK